MKRGEMLTVFCYDVSNNKIRRRVSKLLEDVMTRVQLSVFEGRLSKHKTDALAQRIAAQLEEGDSLRIYSIGKNGERHTQVFGDTPPIEPSEHYWLF